MRSRAFATLAHFFSRAALGASLVALAAGCIPAVAATDGTVHQGDWAGAQVAVEAAARASGARDMPCAAPNVQVVSVSMPRGGDPQAVVEGCGERLTYAATGLGTAGATGKMLLIGRLKLTP